MCTLLVREDGARPGELMRSSISGRGDIFFTGRCVAPAREVVRVIEAHEQVRVALGERMNACMRRWELFCAQDRRVWFATAWAV